MATIGQTLPAPETGWSRYDDLDSRIGFLPINAWSLSYGSYYNDNIHLTGSTNVGAYVIFKFKGTKLRIIGSSSLSYSSDCKITIDGIQYSFSTSYAPTFKCLVFQILNLTNNIHTIRIDQGTNGTYQRLYIDAIDIDSTGDLVHPLLNGVHSIGDIKNIGDCILCRYTALTSGQVGVFSELGTTVAPLIPVASSATPSGSFYWVYVGKDYLGRKKFIADRNIQHSISWDILNSAGVCSENLIDMGLGSGIKSTIRLLTGGISATDPDNEWDKIIVGSTLGGTITAGDNSAWNWFNLGSWSSTTYSANTSRGVRGSGTIGAITSSLSTLINVNTGFRPVLLVETLATDKFLIKKGSNYYSINPKCYDELIHAFTPLILEGGPEPHKSDIDNFGFDNVGSLITSMTKGGDTFIPINKLNPFDLKVYKIT
ncbi:hypothetical protein psyc5s11_29880 [Clostridium gelidum]|uniref:Uncharacterized protein n=1 Tax=Clostridium gelidum TaxID=704125 RepID=A0ABN6J1Q9_9CLOT|nr:hypothetical protein [Clostridium gelidum]BCZ46921.1 hypothetical protein psyc5s11_29880 [Clostridium gelidum]